MSEITDLVREAEVKMEDKEWHSAQANAQGLVSLGNYFGDTPRELLEGKSEKELAAIGAEAGEEYASKVMDTSNQYFGEPTKRNDELAFYMTGMTAEDIATSIKKNGARWNASAFKALEDEGKKFSMLYPQKKVTGRIDSLADSDKAVLLGVDPAEVGKIDKDILKEPGKIYEIYKRNQDIYKPGA